MTAFGLAELVVRVMVTLVCWGLAAYSGYVFGNDVVQDADIDDIQHLINFFTMTAAVWAYNHNAIRHKEPLE